MPVDSEDVGVCGPAVAEAELSSEQAKSKTIGKTNNFFAKLYTLPVLRQLGTLNGTHGIVGFQSLIQYGAQLLRRDRLDKIVQRIHLIPFAGKFHMGGDEYNFSTVILRTQPFCQFKA